MKFIVTFKTPDVIYDTIRHCTPEEQEEFTDFTKKFVEYGEYVRIEFDTKAGTAIVMKTKA